MKILSIKIKVLKAEHGDSILLEFNDKDGQNHHILIDGGIARTYNVRLKDKIEAIVNKEEFIDIAIITHIDDDHIGGIIELIEDIKASKFNYDPVKHYWFNYDEIIKKFLVDSSNKISFTQGNRLETLLKDIGKWDDCEVIVNVAMFEIYGAKISILCPNRKILERFDKKLENFKKQQEQKISRKIAQEETSDHDKPLDGFYEEFQCYKDKGLQIPEDDEKLTISNFNSIAFMFAYMGEKALLLGDAPSSVVIESLIELGYSPEKKLEVECVKLSHHGSAKNTSFDLLSVIDCQKFIISTNGNKDNLPNKKTFAKILCHPQRDWSKTIYFLFNYKEEKFERMFTKADKEKYNFKCCFENTPYGYLVEL